MAVSCDLPLHSSCRGSNYRAEWLPSCPACEFLIGMVESRNRRNFNLIQWSGGSVPFTTERNSKKHSDKTNLKYVDHCQ